MSKVSFYVNYETEVLVIEIDGEWAFGGNFWDFDRPDDIIALVEKLGHKVEVEEVGGNED